MFREDYRRHIASLPFKAKNLGFEETGWIRRMILVCVFFHWFIRLGYLDIIYVWVCDSC